jgi:hypothetical protein
MGGLIHMADADKQESQPDQAAIPAIDPEYRPDYAQCRQFLSVTDYTSRIAGMAAPVTTAASGDTK